MFALRRRAVGETTPPPGTDHLVAGGGASTGCDAQRVYSPQPYRMRSRPEVLRTVRLRLVPLPLRENIE